MGVCECMFSCIDGANLCYEQVPPTYSTSNQRELSQLFTFYCQPAGCEILSHCGFNLDFLSTSEFGHFFHSLLSISIFFYVKCILIFLPIFLQARVFLSEI